MLRHIVAFLLVQALWLAFLFTIHLGGDQRHLKDFQSDLDVEHPARNITSSGERFGKRRPAKICRQHLSLEGQQKSVTLLAMNICD